MDSVDRSQNKLNSKLEALIGQIEQIKNAKQPLNLNYWLLGVASVCFSAMLWSFTTDYFDSRKMIKVAKAEILEEYYCFNKKTYHLKTIKKGYILSFKEDKKAR